MKNTITILNKLLEFLTCNVSVLLWVILSVAYLVIPRGSDTVVFLDIGQGDATLIQQGDLQVLIDGGESLDVLYQISKYMRLEDRVIDIVVLTHPHDDHLIGILHLLERYEIGEIWLYPVCFNNKNYELLMSYNLKTKEVYKGMAFKIKDINIEIVWPRVGEVSNCVVGKYKSWNGNINNDSLVMIVEYLDKRFLLMGDAQNEVEKELIVDKHIDFLKAGHHCSKTSSSETFLKMVKPAVAICSCSYENKYGHPDSGTLRNFFLGNVQYLVTYLAGNIVVQ